MKKILLFSASLMLGISLMAQNTVNLKLNLEKNKVYRLKSTSEQTLSQTMNGMQQTTKINSNSVFSIKMMDATANFIVAEVRFDTIINSSNAMGKVTSVNSSLEGNIKSDEIADVMSCIMNRLCKTALFVKLDYSGKVIEIVNYKMLSDMILKDTAEITGKTAAIAKIQVKNTINNKSLISMIESLTCNLPGKDVTKGEKWERTVNTNAGGMSLDIITNYSLDALQGNQGTLSAQSNIQVSPNAEPLDYGTAKITYGDLKGLGKSNLVLDTKTGLLTSSTSKTHVSGNLNISAQGMNIQMPMDMDIESRVVAIP